ncbi:hypothetical protein KQX54_000903 [Cotesia glomerata]|uniref:Uncharacterized protein n=1 Tax=Cotesia glomerata TaxID=32391 RepID=A0AAV7HUF0_COTGL|nr:hypothetical protein KQX54_000903 [Cotesia glomerata]
MVIQCVVNECTNGRVKERNKIKKLGRVKCVVIYGTTGDVPTTLELQLFCVIDSFTSEASSTRDTYENFLEHNEELIIAENSINNCDCLENVDIAINSQEY